MSPEQYEIDTRVMLAEFKVEVKDDIKYLIGKIDSLDVDVTNHLMHRLPTWATLYVSLLSVLVGGLVIGILTK